VNATAALFAGGIRTFVIGFKQDVDPDGLNAMAQAGGTARAGTEKYYQANDKASLQAALDDIVIRATTKPCYRCSKWGTQGCENQTWGECSVPITSECCTTTDEPCDIEGLYGAQARKVSTRVEWANGMTRWISKTGAIERSGRLLFCDIKHRRKSVCPGISRMRSA
jgi:hypothetical protein